MERKEVGSTDGPTDESIDKKTDGKIKRMKGQTDRNVGKTGQRTDEKIYKLYSQQVGERTDREAE